MQPLNNVQGVASFTPSKVEGLDNPVSILGRQHCNDFDDCRADNFLLTALSDQKYQISATDDWRSSSSSVSTMCGQQQHVFRPSAFDKPDVTDKCSYYCSQVLTGGSAILTHVASKLVTSPLSVVDLVKNISSSQSVPVTPARDSENLLLQERIANEVRRDKGHLQKIESSNHAKECHVDASPVSIRFISPMDEHNVGCVAKDPHGTEYNMAQLVKPNKKPRKKKHRPKVIKEKKNTKANEVKHRSKQVNHRRHQQMDVSPHVKHGDAGESLHSAAGVAIQFTNGGRTCIRREEAAKENIPRCRRQINFNLDHNVRNVLIEEKSMLTGKAKMAEAKKSAKSNTILGCGLSAKQFNIKNSCSALQKYLNYGTICSNRSYLRGASFFTHGPAGLGSGKDGTDGRYIANMSTGRSPALADYCRSLFSPHICKKRTRISFKRKYSAAINVAYISFPIHLPYVYKKKRSKSRRISPKGTCTWNNVTFFRKSTARGRKKTGSVSFPIHLPYVYKKKRSISRRIRPEGICPWNNVTFFRKSTAKGRKKTGRISTDEASSAVVKAIERELSSYRPDAVNLPDPFFVYSRNCRRRSANAISIILETNDYLHVSPQLQFQGYNTPSIYSHCKPLRGGYNEAVHIYYKDLPYLYSMDDPRNTLQVHSSPQIHEFNLRLNEVNATMNLLLQSSARASEVASPIVLYDQNIKEIEKMVNSEKEGALVAYDDHRQLVLFRSKKKQQFQPKVDVDIGKIEIFERLMWKKPGEDVEVIDAEKRENFEREREYLWSRAESFMVRVHNLQGDRSFSPWKGSVLDSIIGVFLTQNVSDHLSSSAFMNLAAAFPMGSEPCNINIETVVTSMSPDKLRLSALFNRYQGVVTSERSSYQGSLAIQGVDTTHEKKIVTSDCLCQVKDVSDTLDFLEDAPFRLSMYRLEPSLEQSADVMGTMGVLDFEALRHGYTISSERASISYSEREDWYNSIYHLEMEEVPCSPTYSGLEHCVPCSHMECLPLRSLGMLQQSSSGKEEGLPSLVDPSHVDHLKEASFHRAFSNGVKICLPSIFPAAENTEEKVVGLAQNGGVQLMPSNFQKGYSGITKKKSRIRKGNNNMEWDNLRKKVCSEGLNKQRSIDTMDSMNYDSLRCADVDKIANTIKLRGQQNMLAQNIKDFLDRLVREHGSMDMEWLRDTPPEKAKDYLQSIHGVGLKSTECVRLLTLRHHAFPVDTNVARVTVRLGWVPIEPLPVGLQFHLLDLYPDMSSVQKYLWPLLCHLDKNTLYMLHCQLIAFGKVFCTKRKPNCSMCPMKAECRHYASASASEGRLFPIPDKHSDAWNFSLKQGHDIITHQIPFLLSGADFYSHTRKSETSCSLLMEEPTSLPQESPYQTLIDIEDAWNITSRDGERSDESLAVFLNSPFLHSHLQAINMEARGYMSDALAILSPETISGSVPKLKKVGRLRTEHEVYVLPDSHILLHGLDPRDADDPSPYLLVLWRADGDLSCSEMRGINDQTVRATLLIPCRTALRGRFPLSGTYFQINEVFADHASSTEPIHVPRALIWNLPRRIAYFGTSVSAIFRGLSQEAVRECFWEGFVCVRGFDRKTREPHRLQSWLHLPMYQFAEIRKKRRKVIFLVFPPSTANF